MNTRQGNTIRSLVNVQEFVNTNVAELGGVEQTETKENLDTTITEVNTRVTNQNATLLTARGAAALEVTLRSELLKDHMAPINRIAKLKLQGIPQLTPFLMPRGRPTTQKLAGLAQGMSKAAESYASTFIKAGLPADFLAQLDSTIAALLQAQKDRSSSQAQGTGAATGLQALLTTGRRQVHVLDMLIRKTLKNNATLLANWNAAKRVPTTAVRSTTPAAPATPTPATPAVATPAVA